MKILMPAPHYYPVVGGIETWTRNIAQNISKNADVFVVTGRVKNQLKEEQVGGLKIIRTSLFPLKNLSHSPLVYTLSLLPFLFFKSLALIKKEKINVVHCQGFLSSFLGFWLLKLTGVPYVVTVQRMESKRNPLKNFIYRQAAVCIGASRAVGDYFEEIGCKKVEVIPNGVDLKRFENLERKPHDGFIVMTVARLEKVKGIEYLIKAITNFQFSNFQLLIIGDGSERKNLENLVEKLNLKEKVRFLGEIPNEKIPDYLAAADCFVLPSLKEGFGIALLEAQAAGIPVIGTKVGGILDLIEEGKTGLLVAPRNPQAIAEAITKIYSGLKLSQINLEKYNWQNIADRVYQVYQKSDMKIIFATGIFPPDIGGPATYVERLAKELTKLNIKISVITYSDENFKSNYDFPVIRILRKHPKGLRHFLYFLNLLKISRNSDLIYIQNTISAGLPALLVSKILKKKTILKVVGGHAWEWARRKPETLDRLIDFQQKQYGWRIEFLRKIQKSVARNARRVITPSFYLKKFVETWGVPEEKIEVIYNAPDFINDSDISKEAAKKKIGIEGDIILSVGRFTPWKGFSNLISLMADLIKINPNFRLVIIGEGEEKENLESKITKLKLENNVRLVGTVKHEDVYLYFRAADIFVLYSQYEGLSHVILEAMQTGVPVITTNRGGNPELIRDNFNGLLVEYNDDARLKEGILKLWQNQSLREKFINNSKERLKDFTWDNLVKQTLNVLIS